MKKSMTVIVICVFVLLGGQTFSSTSDDKLCQDLVIESCTGCHGKERACGNLGKSKKSWRSLIKYMIATGAELRKKEIEQLTECMSRPSAGALAACADVPPETEETISSGNPQQ